MFVYNFFFLIFSNIKIEIQINFHKKISIFGRDNYFLKRAKVVKINYLRIKIIKIKKNDQSEDKNYSKTK